MGDDRNRGMGECENYPPLCEVNVRWMDNKMDVKSVVERGENRGKVGVIWGYKVG